MFKYFILIIPSFVFLNLNAQSFKEGDIVLNANYGGPHITAGLLKSTLNLYYRVNKNENENFTLAVSNSGVINGKSEYGVTNKIGLGIAASYWNIGVNLNNNYNDVDPTDNVTKPFLDTYQFKISALAIGIRGNYHFINENTQKKIDPYMGLTLGLTKYSYDVGFNSNFPEKQLPINTYQFKSGWGSYFSTTFGIRYYPIKFIGLNAEIGWDRGAFLFGGIAFKFGTKKATI